VLHIYIYIYDISSLSVKYGHTEKKFRQKINFVPVHAMKAYKESRAVPPFIRNFGTSINQVIDG